MMFERAASFAISRQSGLPLIPCVSNTCSQLGNLSGTCFGQTAVSTFICFARFTQRYQLQPGACVKIQRMRKFNYSCLYNHSPYILLLSTTSRLRAMLTPVFNNLAYPKSFFVHPNLAPAFERSTKKG